MVGIDRRQIAVDLAARGQWRMVVRPFRSFNAELLHAAAKGAGLESEAIRSVSFTIDLPLAVIKNLSDVGAVDCLQVFVQNVDLVTLSGARKHLIEPKSWAIRPARSLLSRPLGAQQRIQGDLAEWDATSRVACPVMPPHIRA